jgi:two-component system LytT family sensor kinase
MNKSLYRFIFSGKTSDRIVRHLVFWIFYGFYFFFQSVNPWYISEFFELRTYSNAMVSTLCFVPACILSVYVTLNYILPLFLKKKNYVQVIIALLLLIAAAMIINYFASFVFYRNIDVSPSYFKGPWSLSALNTIWAIIISGFATGIKAAKNRYLHQKDILDISRKKTRIDLLLQKDRIQTRFLYSTLDRIYSGIQLRSEDAAPMILNFSNLLSYSLYESDVQAVSLEKELSAIKDFIALEETKGEHVFTIRKDPNADRNHIFIPPMVLLTIFQDSIALIRDNTTAECTIDISINYENDLLSVMMSFEDMNSGNLNRPDWSSVIKIPNKRMENIYGNNFQCAEIQKSEDTSHVSLLVCLMDPFSDRVPTNGVKYEPA